MKVTLFLSSRNHDLSVVAKVLASMDKLANIFPMISTVKDESTDVVHVEMGCKVDLLEDKPCTEYGLLRIWQRLRDVLGIHCMWIEVTGLHVVDDIGTTISEYKGCICEWPYYKSQHKLIGHNEPLACSEY